MRTPEFPFQQKVFIGDWKATTTVDSLTNTLRALGAREALRIIKVWPKASYPF